ncbi:MAG: hypothetical protein RKH07_10885 [Gammaproteobacteria bacterium]
MNAKNQLLKIQYRQLEHDKLFHPDILCLPSQRRAAHMAFHFAKYAGKFVEAKQLQDRELLKTTLIDTFIITVATANLFNKELSGFESVKSHVSNSELSDLAKNIASHSSAIVNDIFTYTADEITIASGRIAKAIESLDHFENYDYVNSILINIDTILSTVLVSSLFLNIDLESETTARLNAVERKSIFFNEFQNIETMQRSS